jgi:hypothetical protein
MDLVSAAEVAAFRNSGRFDETWYVSEYPDVKLLGMDPLEHYLWLGAKIGRKPSRPIQSTSSALVGPADAFEPPIDERVALLANSKLLDVSFVCKQLGRIECTKLEAARFYYEISEERQLKPNPLFDPSYYRHVNGLDHHADPVWHYLATGALQHLPFHRLFDVDWYKAQVPEAEQSTDILANYWEVGYPRGILPFDEQKIAVLSEVKRLFFLDAASDEYEKFNPGIYREYSPDLNHLPDEELHQHYVEFGKGEGRFCSVAEIFRQAGGKPYFVPLDFTVEGYADVHGDLVGVLGDGLWNSISHYLLHGLSEGRHYNLSDVFGYFPICEQTFSTECLQSIDEKTPLCVLMHLYYPEMWDELKFYLDNIDAPFDLYVNLVDTTWTIEALAKIRAERPESRISISANSGRDIGGFVRLLDQVDFDRYVAFATLHSKKSPHVTRSFAEHWVSNLLQAILGSKEVVRQNLAAFIEDETVGIIGAARHRNTQIGKNSESLDYFLDVYGISEHNRHCEYVSGTMMMVRSEIMKTVYAKIRDFNFESGDNKGLEFHVDGQAEHAIERIFGNVAKQYGYRFLWR